MKFDRTKQERVFKAMREEHNNIVEEYRDIAKYTKQQLGFFDGDRPNQKIKVDHKVMLDSTPSRAVRTHGSGMESGMSSPSRPWFKMKLLDDNMMEERGVKMWLDICEGRIYSVMASSNAYSFLHAIYEELAVFGTACGFIDEDYEDVIRCHVLTAGEYMLGVDSTGRVNRVARYIWYTVGDLVDTYGKENVSPETLRMWEDQSQRNKWVRCYWLIEPNNDVVPGARGISGKPWRTFIWEEKSPTDTVLKIGGYESKPFIAPRVKVSSSHQIYSQDGPGWEARGDCKMLMKLQLMKMKAIEKAVDPPMQGPTGAQNIMLNTMPNAVNYVPDIQNGYFREIYQKQNMPVDLPMAIKETQQAIEKDFYVDLFLMMQYSDNGTGKQMTAREVVEKHEEKLLALSPLLESIESEGLNQFFDRVTDIMQRGGLFPPAPENIAGETIKFDYTSILAQAQKMVGTTAIEQTMNFVAGVASATGRVEIVDNFDLDETVIAYADMTGMPAKTKRPKEDVAKMREQRNQQMAAQAAMEAAPAVAQTAKTVSEIPVGQNSALDALLGANSGGVLPQ